MHGGRRGHAGRHVERGLGQAQAEEAALGLSQQHGVEQARRLDREVLEAVAFDRARQCRACLEPEPVERRLRDFMRPQVTQDLGREHHALFVEQLVPFLHQPALVAQLEQRNPRCRNFADVRHALLRPGGGRSVHSTSA